MICQGPEFYLVSLRDSVPYHSTQWLNFSTSGNNLTFPILRKILKHLNSNTFGLYSNSCLCGYWGLHVYGTIVTFCPPSTTDISRLFSLTTGGRTCFKESPLIEHILLLSITLEQYHKKDLNFFHF